MKINLTVEGTPEQLRAFIAQGIQGADLLNAMIAWNDRLLAERAGQILETAVARGSADITLQVRRLNVRGEGIDISSGDSYSIQSKWKDGKLESIDGCRII